MAVLAEMLRINYKTFITSCLLEGTRRPMGTITTWLEKNYELTLKNLQRKAKCHFRIVILMVKLVNYLEGNLFITNQELSTLGTKYTD